MTEIARQKNISTSSVYRVMKRFYRPLNPFKQTLPKVLCFDEFKSVRSVASAMSFIMMDGQSHALLDIVENRRLPYLERYFSRFSLATREAVQLIVIDMYAPYVSLVKKLFPNAQLIIDRFHIVQHIGRTFLNHRVKETTVLFFFLFCPNYSKISLYQHHLTKSQSFPSFVLSFYNPAINCA
ncbi:hypothetical protein EfmGK941_04260 [Enterococcus faecium]|nr:hypothetical protein EfmGK941_04260 [Enterococcus faecium]